MSKWVVDTCVIIDILSGDGKYSCKSADAIDMKRDDGLVIAPITYVELAPSFGGDSNNQDSTLSELANLQSCRHVNLTNFKPPQAEMKDDSIFAIVS